MAYIIEDDKRDSADILAENLALKKEIEIIKTANEQLKAEAQVYKTAYERYNNNFIIKAVKKILRKSDD